MTKNEALQQLLLSTGHALLIDTVEGDKSWVSVADEFELQHLLTKRYILPTTIIDWMTERTKPPSALSHIKVCSILKNLSCKILDKFSESVKLTLQSCLFAKKSDPPR